MNVNDAWPLSYELVGPPVTPLVHEPVPPEYAVLYARNGGGGEG